MRFHVEQQISFSPDQVQALARFTVLLREANERLGLVSAEAMVELDTQLMQPCLRFAQLPILHQPALNVVDLGSGGGFPAIPMAITWPRHRFLLIDSRLKKCEFLQGVATTLGLDNVEVRHARVEKLKHLPAPDLFTARFFKDLKLIAAWTRHWRRPGTRYLLFTGRGIVQVKSLYNLKFVCEHHLTLDKVALEYLTV
jgi:16S rRNA (guanine527-N7)-methyltransferase